MKVQVKSEVEAVFIRCECAVRYDEEDIPNDFPFRKGEMWDVTVDLATGKILDWPQGKTGSCHMKVCDEGTYSLLDASKRVIATREQDYVPGCIPGSYGDYIEFDIGADGTVANWKQFCDVESVSEAFGV